MIRKKINHSTQISFNDSVISETLENKIERIVTMKEPIKDGAPLIYTERKEGVKAGYNIRTDRFEVAIDATDKIAKSYKARRDNKQNPPKEKPEASQQTAGGEPTSN